MKTLSLILAACAALTLTQCGGSNQIVHADNPVVIPGTAKLDCSSAPPIGQNPPLDSHINIDSGHGLLRLNIGPCFVVTTGNQVSFTPVWFHYTLVNAISPRTVQAWLGTQQDTKFELGWDLFATSPDGHQFEIDNELDKHTDAEGQHITQVQTDRAWPAGTQIDIKFSFGVKREDVNCAPGSTAGFSDSVTVCGVQAYWIIND